MGKKAHIILIFFLLFTAGLSAGSFKRLNVEDGLSNRRISRMAKDSAGFTWFITILNIDRYDGTEFRHYTVTNEAGENVRPTAGTSRTFDRWGTPWLALTNGKVYAYDRQADAFTLRVVLSDYTAGAVNVQSIFMDQADRLWVNISGGLYLFDFEQKLLMPVPGFPSEHISCWLQEDENTYYIGTQQHLYRIKKETDGPAFLPPEQINLPGAGQLRSLHFAYGNLYVGTFTSGAWVVDPLTDRSSKLAAIPAGAPIPAIQSTRDGLILVGIDGGGVYQLKAYSHEIVGRFTEDEDNPSSLSGNTVTDVMVDDSGLIWVGTSTNGVSVYYPQYPEIHWKRHEYMNRNSLMSNHVNEIMEDSDGDRWYGTNNGVSLYRAKENKWTHYLENQPGENRQPTVVLSLCEDNRQNIWVGSFSNYTYRIHKPTGKIERIDTRSYVYSIYTEDNYVWLGSIGGSLTRYNQFTGENTYYDIDCVNDIKPSNDPRILLLGTCGGLGLFDKASGEATYYNQFGDVTLRNSIRSLLQTATGNIWMATSGDGLIRFNPETGGSDVYTTANGLTSNMIYSVSEDANGRIWFTTERDLYCLNTQTGVIANMNEYANISQLYFNPDANFSHANGLIAFGTSAGALEFSSHFDIEQQAPARLVLTDFSLANKEVKPGEENSPLQQALDHTESVRLPFEANNFSIAFSSVGYAYASQVAYEYRLEGIDPDWRPADHERMADYRNIHPGKYTFHVKALNKYTREVLDERTLRIQIDKPFWASTTAWCLYILLGIGLVLFIYHYFRNRIEEHQARERIRSFIHLAHDIRIPVTLIKAPLSELEAHEQLSDQGRKSLSMAMTNTDKLFTMVTRLLDLQKTEVQTDKMYFTRHDPYSYLQEKAANFGTAAARKNLDLQLDTEPDVPEVWFDRSSMDTILDNLLSNAVKYTEKGTIIIRLGQARNEWWVEVKDSGIGIPIADQKHLFREFYRAGNTINSNESGSGIGLVLTKKLVKLNHGKITFSSIENKGTSFVLTFPLHAPAFSQRLLNGNASPHPSAPEQEQTSYISAEKETILLAEDNDDMREYLADSLSKDYHVITSRNGAEALEQAREMNPDIIISDIIMPTLRGDEMCRILKSSIETSHIPVILLTALNDKENIIWGLEAGADDYITKPFDYAVLKVRIRNILQSREKLRRMILSAETGIDDVSYNNSLDKEFLDKAIAIIEKELSNPDFAINDFCRELGMSRTSAYNKVKTLTNQAPNDFIRIIRLNRAQQLLRSRQHTIAEVALMVGFSDPKYFSTSFKKQFGIPPSKVGE